MNRKEFYILHMVPLAQLLTLVGAGFSRIFNGPSRPLSPPLKSVFGVRRTGDLVPLFMHESKELLNIINAEVASWRTPTAERCAALAALGAHLNELFTLWSETVDWFVVQGNSTKPHLVESLLVKSSRKTTRLTLSMSSNGCKHLAALLENQRRIQRSLHALLQYRETERHQWLADHEAHTTPLLKGRRVGAWQTLWRNMPWEPMLERIGLRTVPFVIKGYGSDVGKNQLKDVLDQAFGEDGTVLRSDAAAAEAPTGKDFIPKEITVERTLQGMVRLTANHTPGSTWVGAADRLFLTEFSARLSDDHRILVQGAKHEFSGPPSKFGELLEMSTAWLQDCTAKLTALLPQYQEFEQAKRRALAVQRLEASFSADEIAHIRAHFAQA